MTGHVKIYKRGDRGFHGYGKPFTDDNGGTIDVFESSIATGPHVWVRVDARVWATDYSHAQANMHLSPKQARSLIARIQTWLDEIPKRWGGRT